jgi:hypothetical protein
MSKMMAGLAALMACAGAASAGLIDTRTGTGSASVTRDGTIAANEYGPGNSYSYAGAGGGFGGTLGSSTIYMNSDASNLYIGVTLGNNINDNIVMYLNTRRSGGFTSSTQMDDAADPGRARSSDPMSDPTAVVNFPIAATHSFVIGPFGAVLFELQGNGTQHVFRSFDNTFTGNANNSREFQLNLADLDNVLTPGGRGFVDWFAIYTSDSGFMSNESTPLQQALNAGANPGFGAGVTLNLENYNRFQIPTPGALALLGLGGLAAARRRRA